MKTSTPCKRILSLLFSLTITFTAFAQADREQIGPGTEGCTYIEMFNYNIEASIDDGSCYPYIYGCTDVDALNYIPLIGDLYVDVNTSDAIDGDESSCIAKVFGCMDNTYLGFNPLANVEDNSCGDLILPGCTSEGYSNYNPIANTDDGTCVEYSYGCTNSLACNYDYTANADDDSCTYAELNLDCDGVCLSDADLDGVCDENEVILCRLLAKNKFRKQFEIFSIPQKFRKNRPFSMFFLLVCLMWIRCHMCTHHFEKHRLNCAYMLLCTFIDTQ